MVGESIEERCGELLVASEDLDPFREGEVGRYEHAASLVALRDDIEEQLTTGAVEGHEAQLIKNQEVNAHETTLQTPELSSVSRLRQDAHEVGRAREGYASSLARSLDA
jgi:hypothetical protein